MSDPVGKTIVDYLRLAPTIGVKWISSWYTIVNPADFLSKLPISISRGEAEGCRTFGSFGNRVTAGGEDDQPVWPNGLIKTAAWGADLTVQSTSINDATGGSHVQTVDVHYLRHDLTERNKIIKLNGTTPVDLDDPEFFFAQCFHLVTVGGESTAFADGDITIEDSVGNIYTIIKSGDKRCSSAFRMVPKGKVAYIDGAVGSSISGSASARTKITLVATELLDHIHSEPIIFMPHASVGLQDGALAYQFPNPIGPFSEGVIIGMNHTSDKACEVGALWTGRLEPADGQ